MDSTKFAKDSKRNKRKLREDILTCDKKVGIKAKAGEVVEVAENQDRYLHDGLLLVSTKKYGGFCVRLEQLED